VGIRRRDHSVGQRVAVEDPDVAAPLAGERRERGFGHDGERDVVAERSGDRAYAGRDPTPLSEGSVEQSPKHRHAEQAVATFVSA
jgi:hypothetical protein